MSVYAWIQRSKRAKNQPHRTWLHVFLLTAEVKKDNLSIVMMTFNLGESCNDKQDKCRNTICPFDYTVFAVSGKVGIP